MTSLHDDATAVLGTWTAPDPEQERLRRQYLRHLAAHDDAMYRSCRPEHLTASTLVLDRDGGRVLLTLHAKVRRWLQLGGHCEPVDATLAGAALREATEESGLTGLELVGDPVQLSRHQVGCGGGPAYHLDVQYLALAAPDAVPVRTEESDDLRWFAIDDLPDGLDSAVRTLVHRSVTDRGVSFDPLERHP